MSEAGSPTVATTSAPSDIDVMKVNVDHFFLLVNGMIVFLMQAGFAFLEAGSVRSKNTVNILIKNMLDALIGGVSYWAVGWALAYGATGPERTESTSVFVGFAEFFAVGMDDSLYPSWFFQFVFAATAATIVSGSIAERVQFTAYFVYSICITGFVYPPVSHWAWDKNGWLSQWDYGDFAGSGVVHLLGATCALVACILIGPRLGRFDENGKPFFMPGHSVPLAGLGGFILLFGFLAFNGGSQLTMSNEGDTAAVARAIVNTVIGGCGGGLSTLVIMKFTEGRHWSYLLTLNGALTGMVSLCAGCNVYEPWAALVVGCIGGGAFSATHFLMLRARFDDPLDAVAVHGGGGLVGVFLQPFFRRDKGLLYGGSDNPLDPNPWRLLLANIVGIVCIVAWSACLSLLIFLPLKLLGLYRVDRETEFKGNDLIKHGESAYPRDAWVELQYNKSTSGGTPNHMTGTGGPNKISTAAYNNAFEMMPSSGALFNSFNQTLNSVAGSVASGQPRVNAADQMKMVNENPVASGAANAGTTAAAVVIVGEDEESKIDRAGGDGGSSSSSSSSDEGEKKDVDKA